MTLQLKIKTKKNNEVGGILYINLKNVLLAKSFFGEICLKKIKEILGIVYHIPIELKTKVIRELEDLNYLVLQKKRLYKVNDMDL